MQKGPTNFQKTLGIYGDTLPLMDEVWLLWPKS